eukprot:SAG31_NODE_1847_length_7095_cov_11.530875_5_plen_78_part_00
MHHLHGWQASQLEVQVEQLRKLNSDRIEAARKAERVKFETEKSKLREEVRSKSHTKLRQCSKTDAHYALGRIMLTVR